MDIERESRAPCKTADNHGVVMSSKRTDHLHTESVKLRKGQPSTHNDHLLLANAMFVAEVADDPVDISDQIRSSLRKRLEDLENAIVDDKRSLLHTRLKGKRDPATDCLPALVYQRHAACLNLLTSIFHRWSG